MPEEKYYEALDKVLKKRYPSYYYSLHGPLDDASCIEKHIYQDEERCEERWEVYVCEKGHQYDHRYCRSPLEACITLIRFLAPLNLKEIREMEEEFLHLLMQEN